MNKEGNLCHSPSHCHSCVSESSRKTMRGASKNKLEIGRRKLIEKCKIDNRARLTAVLCLSRTLNYQREKARGLERALFRAFTHDFQGYVRGFQKIQGAYEQSKDFDGLSEPEIVACCVLGSHGLSEEEPQDKKTEDKIEEIVKWRGGLENQVECAEPCRKCIRRTRERREQQGLNPDGSDDKDPKPEGDVTYFLFQTRSLDEPAKVFYNCRKCRSRWSK